MTLTLIISPILCCGLLYLIFISNRIKNYIIRSIKQIIEIYILTPIIYDINNHDIIKTYIDDKKIQLIKFNSIENNTIIIKDKINNLNEKLLIIHEHIESIKNNFDKYIENYIFQINEINKSITDINEKIEY
jgi:hypothetical protein